MKKFLLILLLLPGCRVNRLSDRVEIPADQLWELYTELHVIEVDSLKRYQVITAVPFGKAYPKYSYRWHDPGHSTRVGDIVPLTDSLRSQILYRHNWKRIKNQEPRTKSQEPRQKNKEQRLKTKDKAHSTIY